MGCLTQIEHREAIMAGPSLKEGVLDGLAQWVWTLLTEPKRSKPLKYLSVVRCQDEKLPIFSPKNGALQKLESLVALVVPKLA
ncbi:MAG TPA: hypothetical protein PLQ71_10520 [Nitrospira sp.]|nr:hypothetical protein [Nitrospira sp.]